MTEERKIQLGVAVDATGAKQGLGDVKAAAHDMAQGVAQAGQAAGKAIDGIGAGGAASANKVDSATRNMIGSIQRATAALEAGSKSGAKYYETLAAQRGISTEALRPYLSQLEQANALHAKATGSAIDLGRGFDAAKVAMIGFGTTMVATLGAAVSVGALKHIVLDAIEASAKLHDLAIQTGTTVEALSGLSQVGRLSDIGVEQIASSMNKLARNMAGATEESKGTGKALEALGLNFETFKQLSPEQQFQAIAKSMDGFQDGAGKGAVAMTLFGKEGAKLLPMFKDLAVAGDLAAKVTTEQANMADEFGDNLTRLRLSGEEWRREIAFGMLPALNLSLQAFIDVSNGATGLRGEIVKLSKEGSITNWTQSGIEGISYLIDGFVGVKRVIAGVAEYIGASAASTAQFFASVGEAQRKFLTGNVLGSVDAVSAGIERQKAIWKSLGATLDESFGESTFGQKLRARMAELSRIGVTAEGVKPRLDFTNVLSKNGAAADKSADQFQKLFAQLTGAENGVDADFIQTLKLISTEGAKAGLSLAQIIHLQELYIAKQPYMKEQAKAQADAIKETAKAREEEARAIAAGVVALTKESDALGDQLTKELEHNQAMGLSKRALAELEASKLDAAAATKIKTAAEIEERDGDLALAEVYRQQAKTLTDLASAKRAGGVKEELIEDAHKVSEAWKQVGDAFVDNLMRGGKSVAQYLKDLFRTLVLRPILQPVGNMFAGVVNSFVQPVVNGVTNSLASYIGVGSNAYSATNFLNNGFSGLTAPGSAYYNVATSSLGQTLGMSNSAAVMGNNPSAYAPQGTQLTPGGGMVGAVAAIAAVFMAAYKDGYFSGESRRGGQYGYAPETGLTTGAGPSGGDPLADANRLIVSTVTGGIDSALKAIGSTTTLTAFQAAYETSDRGRGGVFAGGTLSNGLTFGESGAGSNYESNKTPFNSKYEVWGAQMGRYGEIGNQMSGTPEQLAIDAQQSYIEAIQAVAGLIPKIVKETYTYMGTDRAGGEGASFSDIPIEAERWIRVYDDAMKESVKAAGLLPKRIMDLIIDVDPEALSDKATTELSGKISALVVNVNGFRAIVEGLPVAALRAATFDIAAGLVEMSGGLDALAANVSSYVDNFYTAEEKRAQVVSNITATLNAAGLQITESQVAEATREQFRAVVESFDLTTEAGQKSYAALLSVAGAFASITPAAEDAASATDEMARAAQAYADNLAGIYSKIDGVIKDFISPEGYRQYLAQKIQAALAGAGIGVSLDQIFSATKEQYAILIRDTLAAGNLEVADALVSMAGSFLELVTPAEQAASAVTDLAEAARNARGAALNSVSQAFSTLQDAVAREKARIDKEYQASIAPIRRRIDDINASVGKLTNLSGTLRNTLDRFATDATLGMGRRDASSQISAAIAIARAGGPLPEADSLTNALSVVSQPSEQLYRTFLEYAKAFDKQAGDIKDLSDLTDGQLSAEQQALGIAQEQLSGLEQYHTDSLERLDAIVASAQAEVAGLSGGLLSIAQALALFKNSMSVAATVTSGNGAGVLPRMTDAQIRDSFIGALGDNPTAAQIYQFAYQNRDQVSLSDLDSAWKWGPGAAEAWARSHDLPTFASGGMANGLALVGERGPEVVEFTSPARVYSADQTRGIAGNSAELLSVMKSVLYQLERIKNDTKDTASASKDSSSVLLAIARGEFNVLTEAGT